MTGRTRTYVTLAVLAIVLDVVGLLLYALSWADLRGIVEEPWWLLETPEPLVTLFALAGLVIALRGRTNAVATLLIVTGFFSGLFVFATGYAIYSQISAGWPGGELACWVGSWAWYPAFALVVARLMLVFPDGAPPSPGWRLFGRVVTGVVVAGTVAAALQPASAANQPVPLGCLTPPVTVPGAAFGLILTATMLLGAVTLVSLVHRTLKGDAVVRAQVKWFALATGLLVLAVIGRESTAPGTAVHLAFVVGTMVAVAGVPAAIGVAILRYRLYDIDRLVSRTVTYATVTAVLLGVFFSTVFLLQLLLPAESDLATAASTLAVAAAFNPFRRRIQGFIDRRFNRARYDAERVAARFGRHLRDKAATVDPAVDLQRTVANALEPSSVSVWMAEGNAGPLVGIASPRAGVERAR